jgi:hypothetical protein
MAAPAQERPLTADEVSGRADTLYQEKIRAQVETDENIGKLICMDVVSGDYEIEEGLNYLDSILRLRAKRPDAEVFVLRIGYTAAFSHGARLQRSAQCISQGRECPI